MTFDSLTFAVFLAVVFAAYWLTRGWATRKVLLLMSSYVFYAFWNPFFVLLLVATTAFDFTVGRILERTDPLRARKALLAGSIAVNLGALGFFKYAQFFSDTAVQLASVVGVTFRPMDLGILLPVGISFYTFESVSYVIDVYRRKIRASRSFLDYGLYVTFFPHLVAGPILRYGDFSPQCLTAKRFTDANIGRGAAILLIGLVLKVLFADLVFAPVSDKVFGSANALATTEAWLGAASFSFQLYCDFAGYSLCAIGTALMFGFRFPSNFESPFGSIGFADLWTRWHISLSSWLRDYVYIPLGGSRRAGRRAVNVMATFLLSGLWHGAAWTYVVWGAVHGVFLIGERAFRDHVWDFTRARAPLLKAALALVTFGLFTIAIVFFRAPTLGQAAQMLLSMAGAGSGASVPILGPQDSTMALMLGACVLAAHRLTAGVQGWAWLDDIPPLLAIPLLACAAFAIVVSPGLGPAFLYFQF